MRRGPIDDDVVWPARSYLGRKMDGAVVKFAAREVGPDVEVTVRQERGPEPRYWLYRYDHSPAVTRGDFYAFSSKYVIFGSLGLAAISLFATIPLPDDNGVEQPPVIAEELGPPLVLLFLVVALAFTRLYFWSGAATRYQRCSHSAALPDALAVAGDPRDTAWATQAVNALRDRNFCAGSTLLHQMMADPPSAVAAVDPVQVIVELVSAAAAALREHDEDDDARELHGLADVVPRLPVLDQETARQAAQTIVDSYRLLDEIAPDRRAVAQDGGSAPSEDAHVAVDAAMRAVDDIVDRNTDAGAAGLKELRNYSRRWDESNLG
ncbi:hypothetical protein [Branchiibius sp. NY16-3462-2]|uniref:hypothetical protein n=1 Tax=Branchiibius sp. NY16-3462-2 TaxID=1807500 RepID=UPI0007968022|nr:hypothetical protein [Branchiibius sp. NY16-3462-2]KYH45225.1 hypothetical protein AZH51_15265 [Branchiibius sp. NY16-3462-2]